MAPNKSTYPERTKKILRVTLLGSASNALLVLLKLFVGIVGHSSAMIAEAINSISDFLTDIIALIFIRISGKPQDKDHHYGHGKFETLASVVMAVVMISVGLLLLYNSIISIIGLWMGTLQLPRPSRLTLIVAFVSLLTKLFLYRYTYQWAGLLKSSALKAKALDHRSDTLALIAVLFGIAGAIFLGERWLFLEPLAAGVVSLFIIHMGWSVLRPAFNELTEECLSPEVEGEIMEIVLSTHRVEGIHRMRTRSIGGSYAIEIDLLVDGRMSVAEGHDITLIIERELRARYGTTTHIAIHIEPSSHGHY